MTRHIENPPDPSALVESLRAFGYAFDDAVCDVIDNSIAAGSRTVDVAFRWDGADSSLRVVDNGGGMTRDELVTAMRLGARSPLEERAKGDLGRFGLGLKTASFSQGRRLAVSSRAPGGSLAHAVWDLDVIARTGAWSMGTSLSDAEEKEVSGLIGESGTVVRWSKLDRFVGHVGSADEAARDAALRRVDDLSQTLSLVYSDWLRGRNRLRLCVSGNDVDPWDPFLTSHQATQELPAERLIAAGDRTLAVTAYVLPHHQRLTKDEHAAAAGPQGWNAQQGFYVYRNRRLLVNGGWLGLGMKAEEHYKLARIRIDLGNEDDHAWQIDVRKQQAVVPEALRKDLHRIARATRSRAVEVYRAKGKVLRTRKSADDGAVWEMRTFRGARRFTINRKHPLVMELRTASGDTKLVTNLLNLVENTVPIVDIAMAHNDQNEEHVDPWEGVSGSARLDVAKNLLALMCRSVDLETALGRLAAMEPCASQPELIGLLREELADE